MKRFFGSGICMVAVFMLLVTAKVQAQNDLIVSNVTAVQRPFSSLVDVTYDLETVDHLPVTVNLYLSIDGGTSFPFSCQAVTGDVGADIAPANGLTITWDGTIDYPGLSSAACQFRVSADDGNGGNPSGLVLIPPVSVAMPAVFTMGSILAANEVPHEVTLTRRVNMAATEVTNGQYVVAAQWAFDQGHVSVTTASVLDALDGSTVELLDLDDPYCQISFSNGVFSTSVPDRPVVEVTWYGAAAYCDWLSLQENLPRAYHHTDWSCNGGDPYAATGYRLPTEAEWELACRALTETNFNTGDCLDADTEACYNGFYPFSGCSSGTNLRRTADVGSYPANGWGLFDMHGNVFEWVNDWYMPYDGDVTDPEGGTPANYNRTFRSGSWLYGADDCRSANRNSRAPGNTDVIPGFRVAKSAE